ncbi:hypothetical protein CN918_27525 [Priestia megaterium]|nr:hypothetical protein CN918_27525 [Priestia megaterium]
MVIRTKKDVLQLISTFPDIALYDEQGRKHYLVFEDNERNGQWTLMRYENNKFTRHGRGDTYCDEGEVSLDEDELQKFVWQSRKHINASLKRELQHA